MIKPSDVNTTDTYAIMDPKAVIAYLLAHGWKHIYDDTENFAGISYYQHPVAPRWKTDRLETQYNTPRELETYIAAGGTVLKVVSARFRTDYPRHNACLIRDLEHHENRWAGNIIQDIQDVGATLYQTTDTEAPVRYFLPLVGTVSHETNLVYYDGPIMFSVRDERERRFIAFSAKLTKKYEVLWYAMITDELYAQVMNGEKEVRSIFKDSSLIIEVHRALASGNFISADRKYIFNLNEDLLPKVGFCFEPTDAMF